MFKKILIANRGEIAVRIIRASKELNIKACVIYSEADINSLHVQLADEAYSIGPSNPGKSYLNIPKIIEIAIANGIDAVHPGYGFLAENSDFIEAIENAGIKFIGPNSRTVKLMGDKIEARKFVQSIGVPVVPGSIIPTNDLKSMEVVINTLGYPIMLKAAAGGGGKGMRVVYSKDELKESFERARSEALKAFNDDEVYIEKFIENPKHIEVQVLSDSHGNHRHLFERECSIQRRHQKIIEEAPSCSLDDSLRDRITEAAVKITSSCNYLNAGTIEFLLGSDNQFYFLEMNTRLQVEHPVTEAITGINLVKEQIIIADGGRISFEQSDLKIKGHSIECRINAEDTYNDFLPSTGKVSFVSFPSGNGVRIDSGVKNNSEITLNYDSLLAKLIVHSANRNEAVNKMKAALKEIMISGVITNIPVHLWMLENINFLEGLYNINTLENEYHFSMKHDTINYPEHILISSLLGVYIKQKSKELKPLINPISEQNKWISNE